MRRVKEGTSSVLLQTGLNESWLAVLMESYTFLRNVTDLLYDGKTPYERRFGQPLEGPIIPFGSLVEYHPIIARKKLETSVAPAMPCKIMKIVGVMNPTKLKQNLRVFRKLMNVRECVWESHYQIIIKTTLQEKETINSLQNYNLVHKFLPMPQAMKIPAAKAAVD